MTDTTELEQLTQRYLDGNLAADEARRLNALLSESKDARRTFSEALNLDSAIAAAAAGWEIDGRTPGDPVPALAPRVFRWLAVAACLGLLIAGAWRWQATTGVFATVENGVGVGLAVGTGLRDGTHTIAAGTVELLTARGARIIIEAPAEFRFESAQRLHMLRGRLSADVPPRAKGFTVITPSGDAVDLGTRFGVDVPKDGTAEIHVFEGEVIAKANGANAQQSLRAGQALSMDNGRSATRELRSSAFIQPAEMRELSADLASGAQRALADAALARLRRDPAAIAVLDFESGTSYPGEFRTVQGRWPGSRAPEFVHGGDHLKLDLGGERTWPQLTLSAWVRLDRLGAPYQSLLHADGWDNEDFGLVHWMVNQAATMRFAVWGNVLARGEKESQPYPDSRTPVLSEQGRWVHLATVYDADAGTVKFYHNGSLDKEVHQSTAYPGRLGRVQIGNWNQEERKLSGRVDELVILGRTMDDAELAELFEAGNPYRSNLQAN